MAGNIVERIDNRVRIRTVLMSTFDKTGIEEFARGLARINPGMLFLSTGGTFGVLEKALGGSATLLQVSDYTGQPETQGGLVKTLDFKIYLGLLTETYNDAHQNDLTRTGARQIDMAVVNLYPFEQVTARDGVSVEEARANIDIGGPCMVRASAKNFLRVASVTDPADYPAILKEMEAGRGALDLNFRLRLAKKAFAHTAAYDTRIAEFLAKQPDDVRGTYRFAGEE
ncbi:MAG: hypothetical protein M5R36_03840 [Deltaproteobacteria bacterium]|nr:hypothetical protein [Deltaproteobacteria bacterium]